MVDAVALRLARWCRRRSSATEGAVLRLVLAARAGRLSGGTAQPGRRAETRSTSCPLAIRHAWAVFVGCGPINTAHTRPADRECATARVKCARSDADARHTTPRALAGHPRRAPRGGRRGKRAAGAA